MFVLPQMRSWQQTVFHRQDFPLLDFWSVPQHCSNSRKFPGFPDTWSVLSGHPVHCTSNCLTNDKSLNAAAVTHDMTYHLTLHCEATVTLWLHTDLPRYRFIAQLFLQYALHFRANYVQKYAICRFEQNMWCMLRWHSFAVHSLDTVWLVASLLTLSSIITLIVIRHNYQSVHQLNLLLYRVAHKSGTCMLYTDICSFMVLHW